MAVAAGGILLTVAKGSTAHSLFLFLIVAQTIFGFGGKSCSLDLLPASKMSFLNDAMKRLGVMKVDLLTAVG